MNRTLKTLLLWLLVLALPMQGYAAATMVDYQTRFAHSTARITEAGHMHHMSSQAGNGGIEHHDSLQSAFHFHAQPHDSSSNQHEHSSCSTCAVCCIGVAVIPADLDWHVPHAVAERSSAFLVVSFSGHIPAGIERPPRTNLA
jgi:hypothetical protein